MPAHFLFLCGGFDVDADCGCGGQEDEHYQEERGTADGRR